MTAAWPGPMRRIAYSLAIVTVIAAQLTTNLNVGYFTGIQPGPLEPVAAAFNNVRWALALGTWNTGLNSYWRMFSPVHRTTWGYEITAVRADGRVELLPLPNQTERSAYQETVTDFRETKFLLNMWSRPPFRRAYAYHLCRSHGGEGRGTTIEFWLEWENILAQDEARATGTHRDSRRERSLLDRYACP